MKIIKYIYVTNTKSMNNLKYESKKQASKIFKTSE